jgi:hypothetical protein
MKLEHVCIYLIHTSFTLNVLMITHAGKRISFKNMYVKQSYFRRKRNNLSYFSLSWLESAQWRTPCSRRWFSHALFQTISCIGKSITLDNFKHASYAQKCLTKKRFLQKCLFPKITVIKWECVDLQGISRTRRVKWIRARFCAISDFAKKCQKKLSLFQMRLNVYPWSYIRKRTIDLFSGKCTSVQINR